MSESQPSRGIYLLPNLFTTAGLFAAFYAIVMAMKGQFENAAIAIYVAMIADAMDGRVARLTNTQSDFGAEYDSLSDMVAFAIAPALVSYTWSLEGLGKIGWLVAFIYTAAGALRLARFNTQAQLGTADKRYFQGLPIPAAAAILTGVVWVSHDWGVKGHNLSWVVALLTIAIASLMVSNVRYYSFKTIDFKGKVPFFAVMLIVLIFVSISIDPPLVLFATFLAYGISGPILTLFLLKQTRKQRKQSSLPQTN